MVKHLLLFTYLLSTLSAFSFSLKENELQAIYSLTKTNTDSAYTVSYDYLNKCNEENDYYGIVKLNYLLGFLHNRDNDIGKSVLHYLEAIRYSDKATYEGVMSDKISVRKNLAHIYRIYKVNDLAINYYLEAIQIAEEINDQNNIVASKFNLALTYIENEQTDLAISTFEEIFELSTTERKKRIINEIGLIHWKSGNLEKAKNYFSELLNDDGSYRLYTAKALHNLGEIEYELGNSIEAIRLIESSIELKNEIEEVDKRSLFISYKALGDFLFQTGYFKEAKKAYAYAEPLVSSVQNEAFSYELFRSLSQLNYELGNQIEARNYSSAYTNSVDGYLEMQQKIQETDKQYNIDLITKRYMDEVAKQERIASILFYSKLISGTLLALLLFSVGYNWYQKVRMRRSIVRELVDLKIID
ncbi:tetratricopeptide repeat protein [Ekhidna sp.]|jgi:tetratricopeptide (TPR) repeat protein|uniref:tetratricopeptide repeat protein n=1 Tax=Ekhidna sp. TaxID=2608089 RepID=UPI0032EEAE0F